MTKCSTIFIPLLAITALVGCASSEPFSSSSPSNVRSTSYQSIGVIESIERGREGNAHDRNNDDAYAIGVRFSKGNRETFTQDNIGRLHVGDRVLIEDGSVRKI